jgi:hypothetical protein
MPLETSVTQPSDLNAAWPLGSDDRTLCDDHLRNLKTAVRAVDPDLIVAAAALALTEKFPIKQSGVWKSLTLQALKTYLDTVYAAKFGANWTVTESAGVLYFATGGVNKMKLDASGNLTVAGTITLNGTV